ncbi:MAG TPA: methionyl-tRNA formyltransferase [Acidimicrobiales bacterium]|nr:methionyl-tRNA formyltransferase [Acidimicrobiales bacterium]
MGTPAAAVPPLRALVEAGCKIELVVTRPDKRRGRGSALAPSPVKAAAAELGLPVSHRVDDVIGAGAELGVVVAFGQLIKPHVLDAVPMVNLHFSLLPRWRGAAPVERAILAGDTETGVCLMRLDPGLDTGPVLAVRRTPIGDEETLAELRSRLVDIGTEVLLEALAGDLGAGEPQADDATYATKIESAEHRIDWARPAAEIHRIIRLGSAWTTFRGRRLRIRRATVAPAMSPGTPGSITGLDVTAGDGRALRLVEVQPEGKALQPAQAWANGARLDGRDRLGDA